MDKTKLPKTRGELEVAAAGEIIECGNGEDEDKKGGANNDPNLHIGEDVLNLHLRDLSG
jgi:hypothetical protein